MDTDLVLRPKLPKQIKILLSTPTNSQQQLVFLKSVYPEH